MTAQQDRTMNALNVLAKWRTLFTGWQLGTRRKGDPEGDAVSDHREATILLRAEQSALVLLLVDKGVFTYEEWLAALEGEAKLLDAAFERRFPGVGGVWVIENVPGAPRDAGPDGGIKP